MEHDWSKITQLIIDKYKKYPLNQFIRKKTHNVVMSVAGYLNKLNIMLELSDIKYNKTHPLDSDETLLVYDKLFKKIDVNSNEYVWIVRELNTIYNKVTIYENIMEREKIEKEEKTKWKELRYLTTM